MNVRKRGLALLMCICMIFTLLPFSAFADASADKSVVYGTYDNGTWTQDANAKDTVTCKTEGDNTLSLTKTAKRTADNTYDITLKVVSTQTETTTKPGSAATVLVMDVSGSMDICATCNNSEQHSDWDGNYWFEHSKDCNTGKTGIVEYSETRLKAAKDAAYDFILSYSGAVLEDGQVTGLKNNAADGLGRYVSVVRFSTNSSVACEWKDVSTVAGYDAVKAAIDGLNADGGTNLDAGLQTANAQFNDEAVKSITAKNVIALTDGMPTFYVGGDSDGNHGSYGCPDTNEATAKSATALKASASVYTVCFGASEDKCWEKDSAHRWIDHTFWIDVKEKHPTDGPKVGDFLRKSIATSETGKTYAYNADNTTELMTAFKAITSSITEGIKTGTVLDPMGDHITVTSKPDNFVETANGYTWELGEPDSTVTENGKTTYTYTLTYEVTFDPNFDDFDEDSYYAANKETTFTAGGKVYNFNVPGVKGTAPKYTVTYKYIGDAPEGAQLPSDTQYKKGDLVTVAGNPSVDGWTFSGWKVASDSPAKPTITDNGQFNMPNGNVVLEGSWTKLEGYTVKYMWGDKVLDTKAGAALAVGMNTPNESPKSIEGYTPKSNDPIRITISTNPNENVIIFEYYKNVTLTANSKTVTYNGEEQTVSGFTGAPEGADFSAITVGAQGTEAGTYPANFTDNTVGTEDATGKYIVTKTTNGNLTIDPIGTVTVTITGNTDSKVYNGSEQSVTGYTVKISDPKYTEADFKFTGDPKASRTDVGTTPMGLNAHQFENKNSNFKNVTFVIENDGYVEVTKRTVTLTSETASKPYDGTALTKPEVTVTGDGFVDGEVTDIKATGSVTNVSDSPVTNTIVYTTTDKFVEDNYNITKAEGKLTITKSDKLSVTATGYSGKYDGQTHNGNVTATEGATLSYSTDNGETWTATEPTIKNVGEIKVIVKASMANYSDATAEYTLKVTPRPVTLTSETASKPYDGTALTKPEVTVTGDGFVDGEVADIIATGSVTNVSEGEVTNAITFVPGDAFNAGNYKIEKSEGKLSITPLAVTVTAKDYTKYVGEKDPVLEATVTGTINNDTIDYTISRDAGETVGTYTITPAGAEAQGNYTVTYKTGTLTIKERPYRPNPSITDKITVEITGNSDSVVYDGTEHSVKDYTVKISDSRYTEKDFTFSGKALASGINAGTYEMGLKAEQFKNTNARFTNVKFVIKADGVLTITPKELTITAGSKTEYGPTPVTCDEWTVSGLAAGDKVESVKITGIQSVPGSSPNVPSDAVIKNAKGEDVTKNYAIKYVNGTLTMLEVLNKEDHFNYIIGTPEGLSLPTANVTRAEVATIFFRLMTDDARAKFDSLDNNFSDVAKGQWYNRAISTLANAGIIKGDPAGTYRPGDAITRAEMAAIIARFGDFKEGGKTFNDISGHWAQKYIELAASNGWINGNPDGTFKPNNNITRAETVAMINRVLDRQTKDVSDLLPVSQMTNWSDNMDTAKWYYRDMQEATNNHKAERVGNSIYEKWTEKLPDIDWASYQI